MMHRNVPSIVVRLCASVLALGVLGGCAMKGDVRNLQLEIRALAARQDSLIAELRQQTMSTQDTIRTQSNQMFDLRGDVNRQLQLIAQSLRTLEALAGENQRGIAGVRDQLANLRRTQGNPPPVTPSDSATGRAAASEQLLQGTGGNANQLYEVAMQQYDRESLNAATLAFRQFLAEHPNDPRAANAHYYLADILTQQNRPQDALRAFQEIQTLFPTAPRVPDAMYRIALLQIELGDVAAAKATLERIMNTYPDATSSMLARDKLKEIG